MVEKNPWWKNVSGPFPTWEGPLGCKEDGGGCHYGRGKVGRMILHRAVHNKDKECTHPLITTFISKLISTRNADAINLFPVTAQCQHFCNFCRKSKFRPTPCEVWEYSTHLMERALSTNGSVNTTTSSQQVLYSQCETNSPEQLLHDCVSCSHCGSSGGRQQCE